MRKLIGAGVAVILAVTLAGCSSASRYGVILECAYSRIYQGFDCNWEGVTSDRERRYSE